MEEVKKGRGGARAGAGRKPSGNKQKSIWMSEAEYEKVKALLAVLRGSDKPGDLAELLDVVRNVADTRDGMAGAVVLLDNVKALLKM